MTQPSIKLGVYAHRFQGNALDRNETCYYLAGLGTMNITQQGQKYKITGNQESVHLPFRFNSNIKEGMVISRTLKLEGEITWDEIKNLWNATIMFSYLEARKNRGTEDDGQRELKGTFVFTRTGLENQYWAMATGLEITKGKNFLIPAEAVSGEVHRIGNLP